MIQSLQTSYNQIIKYFSFIWKYDIYKKPYSLIPIRIPLALLDLVFAIGDIRISLPSKAMPFKDANEFEVAFKNIINILNKNMYASWAIHLESANINATNLYHSAYQISICAKYILQQEFVKNLKIQADLYRIYKHCKIIAKNYTNSMEYLNDMIDPVVIVLQTNGFTEYAEELAAGPCASQSLCERAGVTRDAATKILKDKCSIKLHIGRDLKKIIKFCQAILRSY